MKFDWRDCDWVGVYGMVVGGISEDKQHGRRIYW